MKIPRVFTIELFITVKIYKQPKCPTLRNNLDTIKICEQYLSRWENASNSVTRAINLFKGIKKD